MYLRENYIGIKAGWFYPVSPSEVEALSPHLLPLLFLLLSLFPEGHFSLRTQLASGVCRGRAAAGAWWSLDLGDTSQWSNSHLGPGSSWSLPTAALIQFCRLRHLLYLASCGSCRGIMNKGDLSGAALPQVGSCLWFLGSAPWPCLLQCSMTGL